MIIPFSDIMDYVRCPIIYLMKSSFGIEESNTRQDYADSIKTIVYHYFFRLMEDNHVGADTLKNKWDTVWLNDLEKRDILYKEEKDRRASLGYEGISSILRFHRQISENPGFPLVVGQEFEVSVGKYIISDTIDVVREVQEGYDKKIELIYFNPGSYSPDDWEIKNNFHISLQSYAFRKLFEAKEQRLCYYSLKTGKQVYTHRTEDDFKRLESFIDIVGTSIESNLYYPKPSYACKTCSIKGHCQQWGIK